MIVGESRLIQQAFHLLSLFSFSFRKSLLYSICNVCVFSLLNFKCTGREYWGIEILNVMRYTYFIVVQCVCSSLYHSICNVCVIVESMRHTYFIVVQCMCVESMRHIYCCAVYLFGLVCPIKTFSESSILCEKRPNSRSNAYLAR